MVCIAVADDHAVVREGLKRIISEHPDLSVSIAVGTGEELLTAMRQSPADLAIIDLVLGSRSGLDVLRRIRAEHPQLPVIIFSMHGSEEFALRALRAGAAGYVQKESASEELVTAVRRVLAGGTYVSPTVAERLALQLARGGAKEPHEVLSDRELEVFQLLGAGNSVSEVASLLNLSVKTVSTHRTHILAKTGLRNNAEIIRYAVTHRLV
jgi:DNA-binding NarL/FixJ family response regulator